MAVLIPVSSWGFGREDKGTSAAAFLKIPAGARPAAMGDAFGGLADDVHAAHYNPAGLAFLEEVQAAAAHDGRFQGLEHDFGAIAVPILSLRDTRRKRSEWGVAALSVKRLGASDIERRGLVETDAPLGTFGASDFSYALSYGRRLTDSLALGGTLKLVTQSLDSASGSAPATDAGLLYKRGRWTAGAGWRHWGGRLKLGSVADPLPLTFYGGGSFKAAPGVVAVAEVRAPRDDTFLIGVGGELSRTFGSVRAALRGGWNQANTDAEGLGGISFGGGLGYGRFGVDFAWLPYGDLGSAYHTTVRLRF